MIFETVLCLDFGACEKIKCKYIQRAPEIEHRLNPGHEGNHSTRQHATKARSKLRSERRNNLCVNYISSTSSIDKSDMEKMFDCDIIDLRGNEINKIESDLFEDNQQLESLNLSWNQLSSLPESVFHNLVNLRKLSLKGNLLEVLDADLLIFNTKLEHLDVSQNKLTKISPSIFDGLTNLKSVSFRGNLCIDSAFPQKSLEEIKLEITTRCGEKNLITFIISLLKISSHMMNESFHRNGNLSSETKEATNLTFPAATDEANGLENLFVRLFWLILPIIVLLFVILAMISVAVYNKYFVYSVRVPNRS